MPGPRRRFMARSKPGWWSSPPDSLRYAVAVVSVASALASAVWLQDHLVGAPVPLLLCAVMLSAWFGGLRAGLLASGLSLLAFDYYFVAPINSLAVDIEELPRLVLVAASIVFVCLLTATQHSTAELLGRARDDLDGTVRELKSTKRCGRPNSASATTPRQRRTGFGRPARTTNSCASRITSGRSASTPPQGWVKGGGTSRAMARRSRRSGTLTSPLTRRISHFAASCTD